MRHWRAIFIINNVDYLHVEFPVASELTNSWLKATSKVALKMIMHESDV